MQDGNSTAYMLGYDAGKNNASKAADIQCFARKFHLEFAWSFVMKLTNTKVNRSPKLMERYSFV
ncbi:MAG: hypothetical protein WCC17_23845 [Candidatus Nitrosopolaris sp.]|jgi:hypothetical protein